MKMNIIDRMGLPGVFRANLFSPKYSRDITDNSGGGDKQQQQHDKQHMSESTKPGPDAPAALDLNVEANRLRTFENWCVPFIDKHQLALLGFYYFGPNDLVKCYFCGVEVGMWEEGDDILTDHMRWSPSCSFIRRRHTNNVPINEALLNQTLPPPPTPDVFGMERLSSTVSEGPIDAISEDDVHMYQHHLYDRGGIDAVLHSNETNLFGISQPHKATIGKPEFPEYAVEAKRIESYDDWPKTIKQRPQQLSDAGFFYTGKGDRVSCFSCGGGLKDWEENDDPWEQHAMWYGKCEYLKLVKGSNYIETMAKKRDEMCKNSSNDAESGSSQSSLQSAPPSNVSSSSLSAGSSSSEKLEDLTEKSDEEEEKKDSKLCKICYSNEYNTIFLPCGHVIACAKCASSVTKCPACRQPFDNVMRVYFS